MGRLNFGQPPGQNVICVTFLVLGFEILAIARPGLTSSLIFG